MEDSGYVRDAKDVIVYPGVREALRELKDAGFWLVIVTNQSGIGRGYFSEAEYRAVQVEIIRQLGDGLIDATYFCADHPDRATDRRKPGAGMLREAALENGLDLARSFMVGDRTGDIEAGRRAGVEATILVRTGAGEAEIARAAANFVADDFPSAAAWILQRVPKCG